MLQKLKKMDSVIVIVLVMLMAISIFSIYSVTNGRVTPPLKVDGFHLQMLKYYILGFVVFFALAFVDFRIFVKYAVYIYIFGIVLLLSVSFLGKVKNGAQLGLEIGGISFQPAELFKLILILLLADWNYASVY